MTDSPLLTNDQIDKYWPGSDHAARATPERRFFVWPRRFSEIRQQFAALMAQLGKVWHRSFPRHHELFAKITAEKARELPERLAVLRATLEGLPEHWQQWQWIADAKPVFGEKYVRSVYGDNGHGMGRQVIAAVPAGKHYFGTLTDFIAAANPDTITMLLDELARLQAENAQLQKIVEHGNG